MSGDYGTRRYFEERERVRRGKTEAETDPVGTVSRTFTKC